MSCHAVPRCVVLCRYTPEQCEEMLKDESSFKALLKDAIKGSPVSYTYRGDRGL
jgi:hypothetical protein